MSYDHLQVEIDDTIGELILNRPDARNAMSEEMGLEVRRAVGELNEQKRLRALLIRGAGSAFSAGGDFDVLEQRAHDTPESNERSMRSFYDIYLTIREVRVPTIAVIHGPAIGAGMCFALGCDMRLLAEETKVGLTFTRVGLHPGMGATYFLPRLIGPGLAAELLLTGKVIDAREALRIGLVNSIHPKEELLQAARRLANEIATAAPVAVAETKQSLLRTFENDLDRCLTREAAGQAVTYATTDLREAIAAFREKRKPAFDGK